MKPSALRVAYVGPVSLPHGGAASRRMLGIAQSLRAAGHEVLFGSGQMPREGTSEPLDFEGFPVHSLGERTAEHLPLLLKHLVYLGMGRRTRDWLEALDPPPDAVILYAGFAAYFARLLPWTRARGIPLIFDAVEWYEPSSMPGGALGPYRWSFELSARFFTVRCGNVVAISAYLRDHYAARGCNVVRVPPTLDVAALPPVAAPAERACLTIGFAGSPGHRNSFETLVESVATLAQRGRRIRLRVAGMTAERVLRTPALASRGLRRLPDFIEALGVLDHEQAMQRVRDCDFTVLMREVRRYSMAAFPTKVVESLACGTPVICNLTSDLGEHLVDGREALLCADFSAAALVETLERALLLSPETRYAMRLAARRRADEAFDFRRYTAALGGFLERAASRASRPVEP
ncbi:glycosyltransferase [Candidatus Binatia bacterium]|nr:glycosyltransferase [Candidatus Binatia bacterium]